MLIRKNVQCKVGAGSEAKRAFWIIASTEDVDRDGDRIFASGWKLGNFRKNPVIPWAHDYGQPPVAKSLEERIQNKTLRLLAQFPTADEYPFGDTVYRLYKGGFLNTFSVGFQPIKYEIVERVANGKKIRGRDYLEQELLEVSACTVPSNPNALVAAKRKGIISSCEYDRLHCEHLIGEAAEQAIRLRVRGAIKRQLRELGLLPKCEIEEAMKRHGLG